MKKIYKIRKSLIIGFFNSALLMGCGNNRKNLHCTNDISNPMNRNSDSRNINSNEGFIIAFDFPVLATGGYRPVKALLINNTNSVVQASDITISISPDRFSPDRFSPDRFNLDALLPNGNQIIQVGEQVTTKAISFNFDMDVRIIATMEDGTRGEKALSSQEYGQR